MRLYITAASPFARKVRILVREKGLESKVEEIIADPIGGDQALNAVNPIARAPALIDDKGIIWTDSPLICARLDEISGAPRLIPEGEARWAVLRREVLADGILELGVKLRLESLRPDGQRSPHWMARWREGLSRSLDRAEAEAPAPDAFDLGVVALVCALTWLDFRHPELGWAPARARLAAAQERLEQRQSFRATQPL